MPLLDNLIVKMPSCLRVLTALTLAVAALAAGPAAAADPLVIAHRGASGYLPEHTLGGYELAVQMGADYIEPDLQLTKDGQLVAMHDATLERTTDVAKHFPQRNGAYRVADFTLAELRTLTVQPTTTGALTHAGFTPTAQNPGGIPTFGEVLTLARQQSAAAGRTIGVYPEAKQNDPAMEEAILATLAEHGYKSADDKAFVQSFSDATVRSLHTRQQALGMTLPLVLLGVAMTDAQGKPAMGVFVGQGKPPKPLSLAEVATFAQGVGVSVTRDKLPVTKAFIDQAHAAGLKVHGWTFAQPEPQQAAASYQRYFEMGMDGVFSNYPDLAVRARNAFVAPR